jgi:hypothetical protein
MNDMNRISMFAAVVGLLGVFAVGCAAPVDESVPEVETDAIGARAITLNGDGTGFIGKGDVQAAFGWNNATMQQRHTAVTFSYELSVGYTFACEWWTGPDHNLTYHSNTKSKSTELTASLAADSRKTGQWTGWNIGDVPTGGAGAPDAPVDADCGAVGNGMKSIVEGSVEASGDPAPALYAHWDTQTVRLQ